MVDIEKDAAYITRLREQKQNRVSQGNRYRRVRIGGLFLGTMDRLGLKLLKPINGLNVVCKFFREKEYYRTFDTSKIEFTVLNLPK